MLKKIKAWLLGHDSKETAIMKSTSIIGGLVAALLSCSKGTPWWQVIEYCFGGVFVFALLSACAFAAVNLGEKEETEEKRTAPAGRLKVFYRSAVMAVAIIAFLHFSLHCVPLFE